LGYRRGGGCLGGVAVGSRAAASLTQQEDGLVRIGIARRVLIQTVSSAARFNPLIRDVRRTRYSGGLG
jgi:hypothetical protein